MPPLSLLSIAAYAERAGFSVRIVDLHVERWTIERFRRYLDTVMPRFVGITMLTSTANAANRAACIVKEVRPECTVVVGGTHAASVPIECLRNSAIDLVVRGDGEIVFSELLSGRSLEMVRGISYRRGDRMVQNPPSDTIEDLDILPMPAYHMVPMEKYYPAIGAYRRLPAINMLMTRGCPGKCTFCSSAETPLRTRSAKMVVEEIAHLRETYGIREIQFYDDTFTVLKQNCLEFCRLMKQRKLGVSWTAFVRTDCFNEEMARALKGGGCHQVMFGVESGDDEILRNIRKPIDKERTNAAVRLAKSVGLEVRATFMVGNPGETVESMQRTRDYALELDPDLALFNITTPYPGTQLFDWAKRNGYLTTEEWGDYELSTSILKLPTVSREQVKEAYDEAHRAFYNRSVMYWRRLKRVRNVRHMIDNFHAFFYIVLRHKTGKRGAYRTEWIDSRKEDFWDTPLIEVDRSRPIDRAISLDALATSRTDQPLDIGLPVIG